MKRLGNRLDSVAAGLVVAIVLGATAATPAEACTCLGEWPKVEDAMRQSPIAIVGRVKAQGRPGVATFYTEYGVAYLDVEVTDVLKGSPPKAVRIWDPSFGTSCGLDLRPFVPGTLVAFALSPNTPDRDEYWKVVHFKPAPEDLLLGGCGDYLKRLASAKAAKQFVTRTRTELSR